MSLQLMKLEFEEKIVKLRKLLQFKQYFDVIRK